MKRDVRLITSAPSGITTDVLEPYSYSGGTAEVGLMMILGNFSLNAGTMVSLSSPDPYIIGNFGFGVSF